MEEFKNNIGDSNKEDTESGTVSPYAFSRNSSGKYFIKNREGVMLTEVNGEIGKKINVLLAVQERAEREGYEAGTYGKKIYGGDSFSHYSSSRHTVASKYCHQTAEELVPDLFYTKELSPHYESYEFDELFIELTKHELPILIKVGERNQDELSLPTPKHQHSFVVVGFDGENGEFICFEKFGYMYPYQLVTLKEVYEFNHKAFGTKLCWKISSRNTNT